MSHVHFVTLIRLPFARGRFENPPQAQWDADKDRQLWKVISKSSKTSDLNWVELADKFQVPATFLLQQAAWLYERHLDHVRDQMKKVSGSNIPISATGGTSLSGTGGIAMLRTGSGSSAVPRTHSALSGHPRASPSLTSPPLSRTPSTNTITQSRAIAQQVPPPPQSIRTSQRPDLSSPKPEERRLSDAPAPTSPLRGNIESPEVPDSSSSSSSSSSDTDHPAHRSQLFKRPPRFKHQRPRDLSALEEDVGSQGIEESGSTGPSSLPFASAARNTPGARHVHDVRFRTGVTPQEQQVLQVGKSQDALFPRQKSVNERSRSTKQIVSSLTNSNSESDVPIPVAGTKTPKSPQNAGLGDLSSPKQKGLRSGKEGSEGTPSMGSSFSDIDDAGISQSALEEALLSNMQHGRMSTLSRMSRYI